MRFKFAKSGETIRDNFHPRAKQLLGMPPRPRRNARSCNELCEGPRTRAIAGAFTIAMEDVRGSGQRPPFARPLGAARLAQPAVGELPHVTMAAMRAVHQQGDRLHALQARPMDMDVEPGVDRIAGVRTAEDERIHRAHVRTWARMVRIA